MKTTKNITAMDIISKYMDNILTTGIHPSSIYQFCKEIQIEEANFYKYFGSFGQIESEIFDHFSKNTLLLLSKNEEFNDFDSKDKLLSYYFTLFENFTANRSYILFALDSKKSKLKALKKLNALRASFIEFVNSLEIEKLDLKQEQLQKLQNKGLKEAYWVQFLLILKFWMEDSSASFEKTDLFIEKSVHASFDLISTKPIKSFIDLGKFILKEKMDFKL